MEKPVPAARPDAYVAALDGWRRAGVEARPATIRVEPALEERIKRGHLVGLANGPVLRVRAEAGRVLPGFRRGQRLRHAEPRLRPGGTYGLASLALREGVVAGAETVRRLVREAVALGAGEGDPTLAARGR